MIYFKKFFILYKYKMNCNNYEDEENKSDMAQIYNIIIHVIIGYIAGKLSWECNGAYPPSMRVFYAFMAILFAPIYIPIYLIFRSEQCKL